jgi:hypothetical protein
MEKGDGNMGWENILKADYAQELMNSSEPLERHIGSWLNVAQHDEIRWQKGSDALDDILVEFEEELHENKDFHTDANDEWFFFNVDNPEHFKAYKEAMINFLHGTLPDENDRMRGFDSMEEYEEFQELMWSEKSDIEYALDDAKLIEYIRMQKWYERGY